LRITPAAQDAIVLADRILRDVEALPCRTRFH
jgi:hypothetical protein